MGIVMPGISKSGPLGWSIFWGAILGLVGGALGDLCLLLQVHIQSALGGNHIGYWSEFFRVIGDEFLGLAPVTIPVWALFAGIWAGALCQFCKKSGGATRPR
jgi:hypothetical protein